MSVYACGDLHGRLDIYRKIKEFLKPEDRVIFLGDANDRGPAPWALVKEILTDPQFIYLRGNHEEMLFDLFELYWQGELDQDILTQAASEGTLATLTDLIDDPYDRMWVTTLKEALLPYYEYKNVKGQMVYLSHAGFTPFVDEVTEEIVLPNDIMLTWDRTHIFHEWPAGADNVVVVHGHTPTVLLHKDLYPHILDAEIPNAAIWYADNHKVDIDLGAVWTDCALLLNLDTWEEVLFEIPSQKS